MKHLSMRVCAHVHGLAKWSDDTSTLAELFVYTYARTQEQCTTVMLLWKRNGGHACIGISVYTHTCFTQGDPPGSNNCTVIQLILTQSHTHVKTARTHEKLPINVFFVG